MIHDISMALDGLQSLAREIPENEAKFNDWNFIQYFDCSADQTECFGEFEALKTFH